MIRVQGELPLPLHYLYLFAAIAAEVIGTTALQASEQFTRFWPTVIVVLSYGIAFFTLGMTLKYIPVGIAYAVWAGLGIVLIGLLGLVLFGQKLDLPAIFGMGLIVAGVITIHLFSETSGH